MTNDTGKKEDLILNYEIINNKIIIKYIDIYKENEEILYSKEKELEIVEYENNNFVFKISDNGTGVKKEIIDKIFDPLYTTDTSRKISGLGLSICREFIILHNGSIKAYNNDMNGLTIEFTIPNNF